MGVVSREGGGGRWPAAGTVWGWDGLGWGCACDWGREREVSDISALIREHIL